MAGAIEYTIVNGESINYRRGENEGVEKEIINQKKRKKVNEVSTVPKPCSSGKSGNDEEAVLSNFQSK